MEKPELEKEFDRLMMKVYDQLIDDEDDGVRQHADHQDLVKYVEERTNTKAPYRRSEPRHAHEDPPPPCPMHGDYPKYDGWGYEYDCGWSNSMGYHCS